MLKRHSEFKGGCKGFKWTVQELGKEEVHQRSENKLLVFLNYKIF